MLTKFYQVSAFLLLCIISSNACAQSWQWVQWVASPSVGNNILITKTAVDASGNIIVAGSFNGTITLGNQTLTSAGGGDIFVAKLSSTGTWTQAVRAGGAGIELVYGLAVDGAGNAIVTGPFRGPTATFGATTLVNADNTGNTYDVYVARLSSSGSWTQAVGAGGVDNDLGNGIAVDAAGTATVVGTVGMAPASFGSSVLPGGPGLFVARLAPSGAWTQAVKTGTTEGDAPYDVSLAPNGDAWLTGTFFSAGITFGSTTLVNADPTAATADAFVARINPAGVWVQAAGFGGSDTESGVAIVAEASGAATVTGTFRSASMALGQNTLVNATGSSATADIFVGQYTSNGLWTHAVRAGGPGSDTPLALGVDASGNVLVGGGFRGPAASFGTTSLTNADASGASTDIFLATLNASYNWTQALRAGGAGNTHNEACLSLALTGNGGAVISGTLDGTATLGQITTPNQIGLSFVARLTGLVLASKSPVFESIGLTPNPTHSTASFVLPAATQAASMSLLDALGRVVRTYPFPTRATTATLDLSGLAPGLYVVRCGTASGKLVVE